MTYALHHVTIVVNPGGEFGIWEMEIRRLISDIEFLTICIISITIVSRYIVHIYVYMYAILESGGAQCAEIPSSFNCISALNDTSCAIIHV